MISRVVCLIVLLFVVDLTAADCTADMCSVAASGGETRVLKHGKCYDVTNNGANDIMIPAKTVSELDSFIAATTTNVTKTPCVSFVAATDDIHTGNWTSSCYTNKPPGLQVGDLILITIYESDSSAPALTPPSGFTALGTMHGPQCSSFYSITYYKIATATEVAATTLAVSRDVGTFTNCGIMASAFRGVDTATPLVDFTKNSGNGTTLTFNSVTTTKANSLSIAIGESCAGVPNTPGSGYVSRYSSADMYSRLSSKVIENAGATGNFTSTAGSGEWLATHVVFNTP